MSNRKPVITNGNTTTNEVSSTYAYVRFLASYAMAIVTQDWLAMSELISDKSVPQTWVDKIARYFYSADAGLNPLGFDSVSTIKVEQSLLDDDEFLKGTATFTHRQKNRAEQAWREYTKTLDWDDESAMMEYCWWIALLTSYGYDEDYFVRMTERPIEVTLKDGRVAKAYEPSPLFNSGPSGELKTWWQVAQELPINLKVVARLNAKQS